MPLPKRIINDSSSKLPPLSAAGKDVVSIEAERSVIFTSMKEISQMAIFAAEVFDNLSCLAKDLSVRIEDTTSRADRLMIKMRRIPVDRVARVSKERVSELLYSTSIASVSKKTMNRQVQEKYQSCKLRPQLWKLQAYNDSNPLIYSDPGLFFVEWMRCEKLRQERNAEHRVARKALKKLMKRRRREQLAEFSRILEREMEARVRYNEQQQLLQLQAEQQANITELQEEVIESYDGLDHSYPPVESADSNMQVNDASTQPTTAAPAVESKKGLFATLGFGGGFSLLSRLISKRPDPVTQPAADESGQNGPGFFDELLSSDREPIDGLPPKHASSIGDEYDVDWDEHPQSVKAAYNNNDADLEAPLVRQKPKVGEGGVRRSLIKHDALLPVSQAELGPDMFGHSRKQSIVKQLHAENKPFFMSHTGADETVEDLLGARMNPVDDIDDDEDDSDVSSLFSDKSYEAVVLDPDEYLFSDYEQEDAEREQDERTGGYDVDGQLTTVRGIHVEVL